MNNNFIIFRQKQALVDWEVSNNLKETCKKFFNYATGDAMSGNFLSRHNLKVYTIFLRYTLFIIFPPLFLVYIIYGYWKARTWGTIIQIASDFSVMAGFLNGLFKTNN